MRLRRPSPALVVSIVALVVASGGTALATSRYVITSSSQIKNGAVHGADVLNGSLTGRDIRAHSITATQLAAGVIRGTGGGGSPSAPTAEAFRKMGPDMPKGGSAVVTRLDVPAGAYAVFAKVNMTPDAQDSNLLSTLLKDNKTVIGRCRLDAAGDVDESAGALVSPGSQNPLMLTEQITRTIARPGTITLSCEAPDVHWHTSDASIIAVPVGSATRVQSAP